MTRRIRGKAAEIVARCNVCGRESMHPDDIKHRYCGHCHDFGTVRIHVRNWDDPWLPGTNPMHVPAEWGCSIISHERLGWCMRCQGVAAEAEVLAWRYDAMGEVIPGLDGARAFTKGLT